MKIDAIVLSGRHRNIEDRLGQPTKSMIQYDGNVSLNLVLKEVIESAHINSVVVIGPVETRSVVRKWDQHVKPVFWVDDPDGFSMFQNLMHAYRHLLGVSASHHDREIFFTCSDIPFLTADIVSNFVDRYAGSPFAAVVPIVTLLSCRRLEQRLGVKIPSVEDHLPIALDGELFHLGNMGLLKPAQITGYWLETLCLSRDARQVTNAARAVIDPKRIRLLWHLFSGFLKQNKAKNARQFLRFVMQVLNWVVAGHYFKRGEEEKARHYSRRIDSHFLFREFFPGFGLDVSLVGYDRPEVFLDFDTVADVEFLYSQYGALKKYLDSEDADPDS